MGTVPGTDETVGVVERLGHQVRLVEDRVSDVAYGHRAGSLWALSLLLVAAVAMALDVFAIGYVALVLLAIWNGRSEVSNRYARNRALGTTNHIIKAPKGEALTDDIAEAAEHFVLDPYGVDIPEDGPIPCDWRVEHHRRGVVVSCGDVKWTPRQDGGLMVPRDKIAKHRCLVYVLVVGDPTKGEPFRIVGWAWGHRLAMAPHTDRSSVPCHYLTQQELMPAASFRVTMAATFGLR